jgi:hypothetical protein
MRTARPGRLSAAAQAKRLPDTPDTSSGLFARDLDQRREMARNDSGNFYNRLEATWLALTGGRFRPNPDAEGCEHCAFRLACRVAPSSEEPA